MYLKKSSQYNKLKEIERLKNFSLNKIRLIASKKCF